MGFRPDMSDEEFKDLLRNAGMRTTSRDELSKALQDEGYPYFASVAAIYCSRGDLRMGRATAWSPSGNSVSVGF